MVVPSVSQQLSAIRQTIAKTILPALPPEAGFAQEQAGLVLASLDWAMDVVESEHRYQVVEHADHRRLLEGLLALGPADGADEARAALDATAGGPPDDLAALRAHTVAVKRCVERAFTSLTTEPGGSGTVPAARRLVTEVARRQADRELAWARMTGFPKAVKGSIAEVLSAQAAAPEAG